MIKNISFLASKIQYYKSKILLTQQDLTKYHYDLTPYHERLQAYKDVVNLLEHTRETGNYVRLERKVAERLGKVETRYKREIYEELQAAIVREDVPEEVSEDEDTQQLEDDIVFSEADRVDRQNRRARSFKLPATLELWQWEQTIAYFHGLCAYCQNYPFGRMDHFIPISKGGGTTWYNCVPACKRCDKRKKWYDPDHANRIPQADIERVRSYLYTRT